MLGPRQTGRSDLRCCRRAHPCVLGYSLLRKGVELRVTHHPSSLRCGLRPSVARVQVNRLGACFVGHEKQGSGRVTQPQATVRNRTRRRTRPSLVRAGGTERTTMHRPASVVRPSFRGGRRFLFSAPRFANALAHPLRAPRRLLDSAFTYPVSTVPMSLPVSPSCPPSVHPSEPRTCGGPPGSSPSPTYLRPLPA